MNKKITIVSDAGPLIALITGTGAVLVAAKRKRIIKQVSPVIDELMACGYRISEKLRKRILNLAEEDG